MVSTKLDFVITTDFKDQGENYYFVHANVNGIPFLIGAVYGPNNTTRTFINGIKDVLNEMCHQHRNEGGGGRGLEHNMGKEADTVGDNIHVDTFHMPGLPNPKNSELLEGICSKFRLTDPYRMLYPYKKDFTDSAFVKVEYFECCQDCGDLATTLVDGQTSWCTVSPLYSP